MTTKTILSPGVRRRTPTLALLAVFSLTLLLPVAPALAQDDDVQDQIDVLAEEIARLREEMAIPETDEELRGAYGMGPAASKVYGVSQGISIGGYGEFYFGAPIEETDETGAVNTADFYRFIAYFGYKFTDDIIMNTELEFEHGTTGTVNGRSGSVSVEFAYLDFLLNESFNVRAGNLLLPVGFVNVMHEPPFYRGNFRPEIERRIIPSTWRELGAGAHGQLSENVDYTAYLVNGLQGAEFGSKGVRGGRQKGNRALWEDIAGVAQVRYDKDGRYGVAASGYYGGADHGQLIGDATEPFDLTNWIAEAHGYVRAANFDVRAMFAMSGIDGADDFLAATGTVIPERQIGWYVDVAYDVSDVVLGAGATTRISPWVRYEDFDLQDEVPDGATADPARAEQLLTLGLDVKPHPNVVLKGEYVHKRHDSDAARSDEVRVGAGFVF